MAFLSLNKTHIAAGETFRLTFTDRDGNSGDTVSYTISGTGITADHFDGETSLSGTVTLGANGIGFKDFDTTADFPTGDEFVSVAFASTGYNGIALKVYSSFHYTTDEKIEQTDTFNDWRKKSNGLFARVDALEESKVNFRSDTIIADGVNNSFYLNFAVSSSETVLFDVSIDGITQNPLDAYTVESGSNQINFNETPPVGASISVIHKYEIGSISYTTTGDGSVTPSKLSSGAPSWNTSGDLNVIRDLRVNGELFVDNNSLQNIVNDVEVLQNTTANINLSNVPAKSVSYDLLSDEIQTSLGGNLSPSNYLGAISLLNDDLSDPVVNADKWYFVEGVEGLMTGANAPSDHIEDGGYIFSNGTTWNVRGASPSNLFDDSVSYSKLDDDLKRRADNFTTRSPIVWAITDEYNRSPLYLDELGELQFTPKANTVGTDAIQDGSIKRDKIEDGAINNYKIADDSVSYSKLDDDLKRRADNSYNRGAVWAITDEYNRSPLYLDELGELQFTPKANTIGTNAIQDGSITEAKLANNSVNKNAILNDSVSYSKLDDDLNRRVDNLYNRGAVWAITDDTSRSPLYLDELGRLQFTPKANTIGTDAIQDGSITEAKLANNSVNKNAIQDGSITEAKLDGSFNLSKAKTLDSITLTKDVDTKLFSTGENGYTSVEGSIRTDWLSFPSYNCHRFEITNVNDIDVTTQKLLIRKKNAVPVGHHYMGEWDSSVSTYNSSNAWANAIDDLPRPATSIEGNISLDARFREGYWWRIKNTVTINDVTYNEDDILVYKALLTHTNTTIDNPSTQLGWKVYPGDALVRKALSWDPNESPVNPLDNVNFEYEGECVEVDENGNGYRIGDLIVYKPNANTELQQYEVRQTYDVHTLDKDESLIVNGSPIEYEYRPTSDTSDKFFFNFNYDFKYGVNLIDGLDGNVKLYNEHTGITDLLPELNAIPDMGRAKLNLDGQYIQFYDGAILYSFDIKKRIIRESENRNILVLGDSIANHFYGSFRSGIDSLDNENGNPLRTFTNHGKGSYNSTHMLEAYKYYLEQDDDIASRILLMVGDWDDKFSRSHEVFSQILSMMPSHNRRYILTDYYRNQRSLTFDSGLGAFTANNNRDIDGERELFETYGNALEGTGSFISYTEMLTKTPEAIEYMSSRFDPQFPDFNNQLEVVEEFDCLPFYNVKTVEDSTPLQFPNEFIGKFQGYLSSGDPDPSAATTDKHYYLTDSVQTRTIGGKTFNVMKVGAIIWYDAPDTKWRVVTSNDIHPNSTTLVDVAGSVYKRLFRERNWL